MKSFWERGRLVHLVEVGEYIPSLCEHLQRGVDAVIEKNSHRRKPYYIFFTANWFRNGEELRQVIAPRAKKPPKMLNTCCWKVDNIKGTTEQLWVLPVDAPIQPTPTAPIIGDIAEQAKGLPIIYN